MKNVEEEIKNLQEEIEERLKKIENIRTWRK